jgi:hypothetical protein
MNAKKIVGKVIFAQGHATFLQEIIVISWPDGSTSTFKLTDITSMFTNSDGKLVLLYTGNYFDWAIATQIETG